MKKSLISAIKKLLAKLGAEEIEGNNLVEVIDNGADAIESQPGGGLPPYTIDDRGKCLMVVPKPIVVIPGQIINVVDGSGQLKAGFDSSIFNDQEEVNIWAKQIGNTPADTGEYFWGDWHQENSYIVFKINGANYSFDSSGTVSVTNSSGGRLTKSLIISDILTDTGSTEPMLTWVER